MFIFTFISQKFLKGFSWLFKPENRVFTFSVIGIIVFIFLVSWIVSLKDALGQATHTIQLQKENVLALADSVRTYKDENDVLTFARRTLITDVENLQKYNEELAEELEKEKQNVKVIIRTETKIETDTLYADDNIEEIDTDTYKLSWSYVSINDWGTHSIKGFSTFNVFTEPSLQLVSRGTTITDNSMDVRLITGIREVKTQDGWEIFIRSDNPYFTVSQIDGAVIDPNMFNLKGQTPPVKRWVIGPTLGYGYTQEGMSSFVGVSLTYGIFRF